MSILGTVFFSVFILLSNSKSSVAFRDKYVIIEKFYDSSDCLYEYYSPSYTYYPDYSFYVIDLCVKGYIYTVENHVLILYSCWDDSGNVNCKRDNKCVVERRTPLHPVYNNASCVVEGHLFKNYYFSETFYYDFYQNPNYLDDNRWARNYWGKELYVYYDHDSCEDKYIASGALYFRGFNTSIVEESWGCRIPEDECKENVDLYDIQYHSTCYLGKEPAKVEYYREDILYEYDLSLTSDDWSVYFYKEEGCKPRGKGDPHSIINNNDEIIKFGACRELGSFLKKTIGGISSKIENEDELGYYKFKMSGWNLLKDESSRGQFYFSLYKNDEHTLIDNRTNTDTGSCFNNLEKDEFVFYSGVCNTLKLKYGANNSLSKIINFRIYKNCKNCDSVFARFSNWDFLDSDLVIIFSLAISLIIVLSLLFVFLIFYQCGKRADSKNDLDYFVIDVDWKKVLKTEERKKAKELWVKAKGSRKCFTFFSTLIDVFERAFYSFCFSTAFLIRSNIDLFINWLLTVSLMKFGENSETYLYAQQSYTNLLYYCIGFAVVIFVGKEVLIITRIGKHLLSPFQFALLYCSLREWIVVRWIYSTISFFSLVLLFVVVYFRYIQNDYLELFNNPIAFTMSIVIPLYTTFNSIINDLTYDSFGGNIYKQSFQKMTFKETFSLPEPAIKLITFLSFTPDEIVLNLSMMLFLLDNEQHDLYLEMTKKKVKEEFEKIEDKTADQKEKTEEEKIAENIAKTKIRDEIEDAIDSDKLSKGKAIDRQVVEFKSHPKYRHLYWRWMSKMTETDIYVLKEALYPVYNEKIDLKSLESFRNIIKYKPVSIEWFKTLFCFNSADSNKDDKIHKKARRFKWAKDQSLSEKELVDVDKPTE